MLQKTWFQQIHDDTLLIPGAKLFPANMVLGILLACCLVVIIILLLTRNKKQVCEHCKGLYFLNNWFCGAFDFIERSYFRNHSGYSLALILISIFIINFYNRVTSFLHELLNLKSECFSSVLVPRNTGCFLLCPTRLSDSGSTGKAVSTCCIQLILTLMVLHSTINQEIQIKCIVNLSYTFVN